MPRELAVASLIHHFPGPNSLISRERLSPIARHKSQLNSFQQLARSYASLCTRAHSSLLYFQQLAHSFCKYGGVAPQPPEYLSLLSTLNFRLSAFFSSRYGLLDPQLPCFQKYARCGGIPSQESSRPADLQTFRRSDAVYAGLPWKMPPTHLKSLTAWRASILCPLPAFRGDQHLA